MSEKFLIASDIHGSAYWCRQLLEIFQREGADKLILLGDLLYHGPRNDFPEEYDPKTVFALLNAKKDKIIAVRGNCDSEVDQMVLEFPMMADYALLLHENKTVFLTHGHLFNADMPPSLQAGDLLLNGHFHTPCHHRLGNGALYANCGSVGLPKAETPHSCILLETGALTWIDLETGGIFDCESLENKGE